MLHWEARAGRLQASTLLHSPRWRKRNQGRPRALPRKKSKVTNAGAGQAITVRNGSSRAVTQAWLPACSQGQVRTEGSQLDRREQPQTSLTSSSSLHPSAGHLPG